MAQVVNATSLANQATQEFRAAAEIVNVGDEEMARRMEQVGRHISAVSLASLRSVGEAARLHQDDLMNVQGKERLLAALPDELRAATSDAFEKAEWEIEMAEGVHLSALLRHDGRQDATLIAEIGNYCANLTPTDAAGTLAELAGNARYATLLSGPYGESLRARFGIKDPEFFRKVALQALELDGTPEQRRRSAALKGVAQLRRALGLARGARDAALEEVKQAPRPTQPGAGLLR